MRTLLFTIVLGSTLILGAALYAGVGFVPIAVANGTQQAPFSWSAGFAQGNMEYSTTNGPGNSFTISCDVGGVDPDRFSMFIDVADRGPPPNEPVRMFVDGEEFSFFVDERGHLATDCNACLSSFDGLWTALRLGDQFLVVLDDGRSSSFSLAGASDVLPATRCGK